LVFEASGFHVSQSRKAALLTPGADAGADRQGAQQRQLHHRRAVPRQRARPADRQGEQGQGEEQRRPPRPSPIHQHRHRYGECAEGYCHRRHRPAADHQQPGDAGDQREQRQPHVR